MKSIIERITKVTQTLPRENGSEVRIIAEIYFGSGLAESIHVMVHRRDNASDDWKLCNDRLPNRDWNGVDDYIKNGRSEVLQTVTPIEILKVINMLDIQ